MALDKDCQRFEGHLKENDAKLQEALRRADAEARARADKAAEAKRLAASIAGIRGEMTKIQEQLQECQRWVCALIGARKERNAGGATGW